jgi:hypothetical protein
MKYFGLVCFLMGCATTDNVSAATGVKLSWYANTEKDLAGYKVYYGNAPKQYKYVKTVGKVTTTTISIPSGLWYFAATAYDTSGNESGFSNEVMKRKR